MKRADVKGIKDMQLLADEAASYILKSENTEAVKALHRHVYAMKKGCPCRHYKHYKAVVEVAESIGFEA